MIVFCPGCGSRISVQPPTPGGDVECPRCHSTFATAGLKEAPADAPPPKRFRPKKAGRSKLAVFGMVLLVLLVVGGGTAGVLFFTGLLHLPGSKSTEPVVKSGGTSATTLAGWKEFESSEAHVRALMPGEPKRTARRTKDVAYELEKDGVAYGIVFADLDQAKVKDKTPEQIIQQQHDQWAVGARGKLVGEKDVTAGTFKGKEFVVDLPGQGKAYMRYFAAGRRLYTVMVVGKARAPDPGDVAKLFESFQITG